MLRQLLAHPGAREETFLRSRVGVMALHGGLEQGTASIAREVAERGETSLYLVEQPPQLAWHVPSTMYDPEHSEALRRFLRHVELAVSLHGFGRAHLRRSILLGGASGELRRRLASHLRATTRLDVVDDISRVPRGLRGLHPRNPVNLPPGGGAQLELARSARRPPHRAAVVAAILALLAELEGPGATPVNTLPGR